ncbi:MAG: hypothetical protein NVS3B18_01670 [Candidatus Dormibacteria bacterium]
MKAMSREELWQLPAVVDLETAGRALGIGRTKAFELARSGEWPTPLLPLGRATYRVPTEPLLRLLGLADTPATPGLPAAPLYAVPAPTAPALAR